MMLEFFFGKPTLVRLITTMQAKRSFWKGYKLFVVQIFRDGKANDNAGKKEIKVMEKDSVLHKFKDAFINNIMGLPPHI